MMNDFAGKECPFCKTKIKVGDDIVICSKCDMPHHKDCWIENQGCTTFGCDGTVQSIENTFDNTDFEIEIYDQSEEFEQPNGITSFCSRCGNRLDKSSAFCSKCGNRISNQLYHGFSGQESAFNVAQSNQLNYQYNNNQNQYQYGFQTSNFGNSAIDNDDIKNNKKISVLCYFGIFLLIPLLSRPLSRFVRFHANQGLICLVSGIIIGVLCYIPVIGIVAGIAEFALFILEIIGIVNCCKGEAKELPIIGKFKIIN